MRRYQVCLQLLPPACATRYIHSCFHLPTLPSVHSCFHLPVLPGISKWKLPLRGRITCRHCRQPKLTNFLYSSNTTSWRLIRRANNNSQAYPHLSSCICFTRYVHSFFHLPVLPGMSTVTTTYLCCPTPVSWRTCYRPAHVV